MKIIRMSASSRPAVSEGRRAGNGHDTSVPLVPVRSGAQGGRSLAPRSSAMRSVPVLRPLPWTVALGNDLSDGLPRCWRELAFLRDRAVADEVRVEARPLKEAA